MRPVFNRLSLLSQGNFRRALHERNVVRRVTKHLLIAYADIAVSALTLGETLTFLLNLFDRFYLTSVDCPV